MTPTPDHIPVHNFTAPHHVTHVDRAPKPPVRLYLAPSRPHTPA
jgi:hypothetical protein